MCVVELKIYSCSVVGGGMAGRHVSKGTPNRPNRLVELVAVHFWTPMFALDSQWSIGCNVCIGPTGIHALHSSIESLSREIAKGCSELSWKLGEKHQMAWAIAKKANEMCNYHKIHDYREAIFADAGLAGRTDGSSRPSAGDPADAASLRILRTHVWVLQV